TRSGSDCGQRVGATGQGAGRQAGADVRHRNRLRMTWQVVQYLLGGGLLVNIVILAAAWGDMRRQIAANRERQDERHEETDKKQDERHAENTRKLDDISHDVKRTNGRVTRLEEQVVNHQKEINRLRDRS